MQFDLNKIDCTVICGLGRVHVSLRKTGCVVLLLLFFFICIFFPRLVVQIALAKNYCQYENKKKQKKNLTSLFISQNKLQTIIQITLS